MTINDCRIIEIPKFLDERGNLSFAQNNTQIPFEIKRTYWIYDVPGGEERGGHAERENEEFIIAMSGSFDITVDDGSNKKTFTLNRSYYGLYIPKGIWRDMSNFSTNSLALEFGSIPYNADDYIRDYDEFVAYCKTIKEDKPSQPKDNIVPPARNQKYNVFDCTMVELDKHHSNRKGNLTVVENGNTSTGSARGTLPFDVKRVYYLYDVPGGESRGAHAHRDLEQFIVAASGSFTVTLNDGKCKRTFSLNRPYQGLYVKPGIWRDLDDFSSGAVCMVLASEVYQKEDYIRDYEEFLKYRKE